MRLIYLAIALTTAACVHKPIVATNTYSYNNSHAACTHPVKDGMKLPANFTMKFKSNQSAVDVGELWDPANPRPNPYCFRKICTKNGESCQEFGLKELRSSIKIKREGANFQIFKSNRQLAENKELCEKNDLTGCARHYLDLTPKDRLSTKGERLRKRFCDHPLFYCFTGTAKPNNEIARKVKGWSSESSTTSHGGVVHHFRYYVDPRYKPGRK